MSAYSRKNPSPFFQEIVQQYEIMHTQEYAPLLRSKLSLSKKNHVPGGKVSGFVTIIKKLIEEHEAETLLDYGSGQGHQYTDMWVRVGKGLGQIYKSLEKYWGVKVTCYDPGVEQFCAFPEGKFDAVITSDVLEHIPEEDIRWALDEQFAKANKFVFGHIASYPSFVLLPNGINAHVNVKPHDWWKKLAQEISKNYPSIAYYFVVTESKSPAGTFYISNKEWPTPIPSGHLTPRGYIKSHQFLFARKWKGVRNKLLKITGFKK